MIEKQHAIIHRTNIFTEIVPTFQHPLVNKSKINVANMLELYREFGNF